MAQCLRPFIYPTTQRDIPCYAPASRYELATSIGEAKVLVIYSVDFDGEIEVVGIIHHHQNIKNLIEEMHNEDINILSKQCQEDYTKRCKDANGEAQISKWESQIDESCVPY